MAKQWNIFARRAKPGPRQGPKQTMFCSFCGKDSHTVKALIAGPAVFICDECVAICNQCLGGEEVPVQTGSWEQYSDDKLLEMLGRSAAIAERAGDMLNSHVDTLRKREVTWEAIGKALGISRQAAWQRFS